MSKKVTNGTESSKVSTSTEIVNNDVNASEATETKKMTTADEIAKLLKEAKEAVKRANDLKLALAKQKEAERNAAKEAAEKAAKKAAEKAESDASDLQDKIFSLLETKFKTPWELKNAILPLFADVVKPSQAKTTNASTEGKRKRQKPTVHEGVSVRSIVREHIEDEGITRDQLVALCAAEFPERTEANIKMCVVAEMRRCGK